MSLIPSVSRRRRTLVLTLVLAAAGCGSSLGSSGQVDTDPMPDGSIPDGSSAKGPAPTEGGADPDSADPHDAGGPRDAATTTFATGLNDPWAIAVDTTSVYVATSGTRAGHYADGTIVTALLGGGSPQVLAHDQHVPRGIRVDGSRVYWTGGGSSGSALVMTVPLGGGTPVSLLTGNNTGGPFELADDGASLYTTDGFAVYRAPRSGGAAVYLGTPSSLIGPGSRVKSAIAVDGSNAYFAAEYFGGHDAVMKCSLAGCGSSPELIATSQNWVSGIAVDATTVYWTEAAAVMTCPIVGCTIPTTLASGQASPDRIAVDTTNVYWTNFGTGFSDGSVMKVPIAGGAPVPLASALAAPGALVLDATSVYFTNRGTNANDYTDGSLMRVAK